MRTHKKPPFSFLCFWNANTASAPVLVSTASNPPLSIALRSTKRFTYTGELILVRCQPAKGYCVRFHAFKAAGMGVLQTTGRNIHLSTCVQ